MSDTRTWLLEKRPGTIDALARGPATDGLVEVVSAAERDRLTDEVEALRQGLWDAGTISGMDTDGDTTPGGMDSKGLVSYILGEVKELREGYDAGHLEVIDLKPELQDLADEIKRLSGLLEQARGTLVEAEDWARRSRATAAVHLAIRINRLLAVLDKQGDES